MNRDQLYNQLIDLLYYTSPFPYEYQMLSGILPEGGEWDSFGNYIYVVPGKSTTLFAAHLDTIGNEPRQTKPIYIEKNRVLISSGNSDCLGGDDRCGILCLLALIDAKVPGTYIFHSCEERGMQGADFIVNSMDLTLFDRAIEFDRRGTDSIISKMIGMTVCSYEFVNSLSAQLGLGFRDDPTGLITDVFSYNCIIPEVTNLSVGFNNEHSNREYIHVLWLIDRFIPQLLKVNWESLPVVRNPIFDEFDYGLCDFCGNSFEKINSYNMCDQCEMMFREEYSDFSENNLYG